MISPFKIILKLFKHYKLHNNNSTSPHIHGATVETIMCVFNMPLSVQTMLRFFFVCVDSLYNFRVQTILFLIFSFVLYIACLSLLDLRQVKTWIVFCYVFHKHIKKKEKKSIKVVVRYQSKAKTQIIAFTYAFLFIIYHEFIYLDFKSFVCRAKNMIKRSRLFIMLRLDKKKREWLLFSSIKKSN